jgi:hypothetical protein
MRSQSIEMWRPANQVMAVLATLALAACGGGDGDRDDLVVADPPGTLRGTVVVNGTVQNAMVCMDLNDNGACDAGEPVSAMTGPDGAYLLQYDPAVVSAQQVAAASLIAPQVPAPAGMAPNATTTIDSADGLVTAEESAYVLKQVPGRTGQINPLTTMVAQGMAGGMSEADARSNLAIQLGIGADKIDSYQSDPALSDDQVRDNARTMAVVVAFSLEQGHNVSVGRQAGPLTGLGTELVRLQFTDTANYNLREFSYTDKQEGSTTAELSDVRRGQSAGGNLANLYNQAYLGPNGWRLCDDTVPITFTIGVPNRSTFCGAQVSVGARRGQTIAGQTMESVVSSLLADPLNFINAGAASNAGLLSALGTVETFPAGSSLRRGYSLNLNQPVFINSLTSDGQPQARATTLEQLVAARPASGVNLSNSFGSLSLGALNAGQALRVAFIGSGGPVQYYVCDANTDFTTFSNCAATAQGSYTISTENGVRLMRFSGHPETTMNNIRLYAEVQDATQVNPFISGNWVFQARQIKPNDDFNFSEGLRLNGIAWDAMKTRLGI